MRYSAIIKFFAVILCAAVLLSAIASGVGLLALTECGLYNRSFTDFYNEEMDDKAQFYGRQVAGRYATFNLGGAGPQLANEFYPVSYAFFVPSRVGYVLRDADGTVLQTQELAPYTAQQTIDVKVDGRYMKVLKMEPMEETALVPSEPADIQLFRVPSGNTEISNVTLEFADGSLEQHELPENGYLEVTEAGNLRLTADYLNSPGLNEEEILTYVTLLDEDRQIAYDAYGANGLLLGYTRQDGQSILVLPGNPFETALSDLQPEGFGDAYVTKCPETAVNLISVTVDYAEGSQDRYIFTDSATLEPMEDGSIRFCAENMESLVFFSDPFRTIKIQFFGEDGRMVYEARGSADAENWYYPQEYHREGTTEVILPGKAYLNRLYGTTLSNGDFTAYDAIPTIGADVAEIRVSYGTLEEGTTSSESAAGSNLGDILRDGKGNPRFEARQAGLLDLPEDALITSISFLNENGELLYEASCPSGVGTLDYDINGYLVFQANTPGLTATEEAAPEVTKPAEEAALRGVVLRDTDVYSMPSLSGKTEIWVKAGTEVAVLQRESIGEESWARIDLGWISMKDVVLEQTGEPETLPAATEPETDISEPVQAVAVGDAIIYSMPNAEKSVGELKRGDTVTVLKQEAYMGEVWGLTETGWVRMGYLDVVEPETSPAATEPETALSEPVQAMVKKNAAFYSTPKTENPLGEVKKGDTVTILKQESYMGKDWALTNVGWVQMAHLTIVEPVPIAIEVPLEEEKAAAETIPQETVASETIPGETIPDAPMAKSRTTETAEEEDPLAGYDPASIETYIYYDGELEQRMQVLYVMEPLPDYILELQLAPGADRSEMLWMLLRLAYELRSYLLMILGGSLALLGLCIVYLCCASAHKRGSGVIRAGGLNRLPLDGYLVLDACLVTGLVILGYEGTEYFIQNGLKQFGLGLLAGSAYICSLLLVGYFFAFVAQIKTPGGYWWRNSLCGRMLLLVVRLCRKTVVFCGSSGWSLARRFCKWLWQFCTAMLLFGKKTVLRLWDVGKRLWLWFWDQFGRGLHWISGNLARLFGLLPITWQFLATGFVLVFFLYIMIRTYKVGYLLLGFGVFFAVILYAASAFAILLESAKRMSRGDLDTKVDDRMLIGGFREFAQQLNDLAGVAVIAAQKQLKSERMKTELITNVSHDIKTPLTSIINYVDLLQKPHTEQQQEQYLEVLDRQSQRLKKLIDDLMEMSKASTGNLTVDIEQVDAAEAVNQALGEFADKLEKAQLTPVFRQPEDQVYMMADGRLVWRIMSNILGNAVKYALPGTRIYLDLMEMDGKVVISMKNISREELNVNAEELMERFVRGDASRNTEGSGLGLNIAQSLMELQRGQLQILVDGDLFKVTLIFPGA